MTMFHETPHYVFVRFTECDRWRLFAVARHRLDALNHWHYLTEVCGFECAVL